jgi:hypothetical protein
LNQLSEKPFVNIACPLCQSDCRLSFYQDNSRHYWQCQDCFLVYLEFSQRLSCADEKAQYDLHQNFIHDEGYRQFLNRLFEPLMARTNLDSRGLDYGCGPGPTLSKMFEEAGRSMCCYDIFYANDTSVLTQNYHFITATEVVEHLFQPGDVFNKLWQQLIPGGILGLMTKLLIDVDSFSRWHYKNDPTHVCFFSRQTFKCLAKKLNAKLEIIGKDVILLTKVS